MTYYPEDWQKIEGNYPRTAEELVLWAHGQGKDMYGDFTIITGYEGQGGCFFCGSPFPPGRPRRFCSAREKKDEYSCGDLYNFFFVWNFAKAWCAHRAGHKCAFCGKEEDDIWYGGEHNNERHKSNMQTHHIIPILGRVRWASPYNVPWNLLYLCTEHHKLVTQKIKEGIYA
jgi:hypothetical protein